MARGRLPLSAVAKCDVGSITARAEVLVFAPGEA